MLLGASAWKVCKIEIETDEKLNLNNMHTTLGKPCVGVARERYGIGSGI